jgi:YfiH family protein
MSELKSRLLDRLPWVRHGFGTRLGPLDQSGMASLKQIHSAAVLIADRAEGCIGEGDALVTSENGLSVSVRTADCLPILLADSKNRVVAAVHAGWRGTAASIAVEALRRMQRDYGTRAEDIFAAIGPGIGVCCYRVGEDVARQFGRARGGKLDLAAENVRQLASAEIPPDQIDTLGACTFCDPERFHSWRRDHDRAARMISYIAAV